MAQDTRGNITFRNSYQDQNKKLFVVQAAITFRPQRLDNNITFRNSYQDQKQNLIVVKHALRGWTKISHFEILTRTEKTTQFVVKHALRGWTTIYISKYFPGPKENFVCGPSCTHVSPSETGQQYFVIITRTKYKILWLWSKLRLRFVLRGWTTSQFLPRQNSNNLLSKLLSRFALRCIPSMR